MFRSFGLHEIELISSDLDFYYYYMGSGSFAGPVLFSFVHKLYVIPVLHVFWQPIFLHQIFNLLQLVRFSANDSRECPV